jgi:GT2 family glycosyltransferase
MNRVSVIIAHLPERSQEMLDDLCSWIQADFKLSEIQGEIITDSNGTISQSRNSAAQKATGEILVFLDDDVKIREGFFREILQPFQDPAVGIVGGVNLNFDNLPLGESISAVLFASPLIMAKSASRYTPRGNIRETDESEIIACVMAVRKIAFLAAGGFPEDVIPCEENVLINKIQDLGWKVVHDPFVIVFHKRPSFPGEYAKKIFFYGKGRGIMLRSTGSRGAPKMLWKPSWKWPIYFFGFIIHYAAYFSGVVYGYLRGGRKK